MSNPKRQKRRKMKNKMIVKNKKRIYCAGIYCLKNVENNEILYVGSAIECNDALSRHLYNLKRNLYEGTNKEPLGSVYNRGSLEFEVIRVSEYSDAVRSMSDKEKESLQEALSVLEKFYIDLHKDTIINVQMRVTKHSSNNSYISRYKRQIANRGSNNPNVRHDGKLMAEILWLKNNTKMKPREIAKYYSLSSNYICRIGYDRWLHLHPIKPEWYMDLEGVS